jgi:hypothetical protein
MAKGHGKLPDLSSKYVFHLTRALNCLDRRDWLGASTGLHALNSVLPDEYQIKTDTIEYNRKIKTEIIYICNNKDCEMQIKELVNEGTDEEHIETKMIPTENKIIDIKFSILYNNTFDSTFSGERESKVWVCPKCNNVSKVKHTQIIKPELQQPFFLRVVPSEPPKFGLDRGINYEGQFKKWFANYYHELENSARDVRIDYVGQMEMQIDGGLPQDLGDKA